MNNIFILILNCIPIIITITFIISIITIIYTVFKNYKKHGKENLTNSSGYKDLNLSPLKYVIITLLIVNIGIPVVFMLAVLTTINNDLSGIILTILAITMIALLIKIFAYIKNKIIINSSSNDEKYIRDIPSKLSPAMVSYLYNQKIEKRKDVIATILNLCAKKAIKLETDENRRIIFKKVKGLNAELSKDEIYIYEWLMNENKERFQFNKWKRIIINEYNKKGYSYESNLNFSNIAGYIYFIIFIIIFAIILILGTENMVLQQYSELIMSILLISFAVSFLGGIFSALRNVFFKEVDRTNIYTKKGAKELSKWNKFKKFIEDYSLIKDAKLESIIVSERYLAYAIALGINKNYNELESKELKNFLDNSFNKTFDEYIETVIKFSEHKNS